MRAQDYRGPSIRETRRIWSYSDGSSDIFASNLHTPTEDYIFTLSYHQLETGSSRYMFHDYSGATSRLSWHTLLRPGWGVCVFG